MWTAFKQLPLAVKLGSLVAILVALAALLFAAHQIGYSKGQNISKVAIAKYERQVSDLKTKLVTAQAKTDVRIVTEYSDRVKVVERVEYRNRDVIRQSVPQQVNLSEGWIAAYNDSVMGLEINAFDAAKSEPSKVTDVEALVDIASNNALCLANAEQMTQLQNWIRETQKNAEAVNR